MNNYKIGSIIELKKTHPCGNNIFEIIRLGVDIKLKCKECGHIVMLDRIELNKKIKKVVQEWKRKKNLDYIQH